MDGFREKPALGKLNPKREGDKKDSFNKCLYNTQTLGCQFFFLMLLVVNHKISYTTRRDIPWKLKLTPRKLSEKALKVCF